MESEKKRGIRIGYCRSSMKNGSIQSQIDALKNANCARIFSDHISGIVDERPGLDEALKFARAGDTICVNHISRLSRSLSSLIRFVNDLNARGIEFISLNENISTEGPTGRLIFHIFSALSEFERDMIRSRCKAGIDAARARGRFGGRPKVLDNKKTDTIKKMYKAQVSVKEISKQIGISETTIYRCLKD